MRTNTTECYNPLCHAIVPTDCIIVITTAHVRVFCAMSCVVEGYNYVMENPSSPEPNWT